MVISWVSECCLLCCVCERDEGFVRLLQVSCIAQGFAKTFAFLLPSFLKTFRTLLFRLVARQRRILLCCCLSMTGYAILSCHILVDCESNLQIASNHLLGNRR